jgi:hypothetical protein
VTPSPFDLPLHPSEAAELAALIFQFAEGKPLTDDIRNRIASRAAVLKLESLTPYFGSLARDPVHHGAYYFAAAVTGGLSVLLHIAAASAPTGIFPKATLIGRMRPASGRELVVNAIPFGAAEPANLDTFVSRIDTAFLPQPQRPGIALLSPDPAGAFEAFRAVRKRTGRNMAALAGPYPDIVWAAVQSGWREGYVAAVHADRVETVRQFPRYSRFRIAGAPDEVARMAVQIRQSRSAARVAGAFELGIPAASPDSLTAALEHLRNAGYPAQVAEVRVAPGEAAAYAAAARSFNCILSVRAAEHSPDDLRSLARETAGRLTCAVDANSEIEELAELLLA